MQLLRSELLYCLCSSLLDSELFEISHIRTIYHMFVAVLLVFCISTLAVDYIDQGRSVKCMWEYVCVIIQVNM